MIILDPLCADVALCERFYIFVRTCAQASLDPKASDRFENALTAMSTALGCARTHKMQPAVSAFLNEYPRKQPVVRISFMCTQAYACIYI